MSWEWVRRKHPAGGLQPLPTVIESEQPEPKVYDRWKDPWYLAERGERRVQPGDIGIPGRDRVMYLRRGVWREGGLKMVWEDIAI